MTIVVTERRRQQKLQASRTWRRKHRDVVKRNNDDYRAANLEKLNVYWKAWKRAHKESARKTTRGCYLRNRTFRLQQIKAYKSRNRLAVKLRAKRYDAQPHRKAARDASTIKWRKANPDKVRAHTLRRRALRRGGVVGNDSKSVNRVVAEWKRCKTFVCYYCGMVFKRESLHIDHVVPLAKHGEHSVKNLARSCSDCNLKKRDTDIADLEFLDQKLLSL